MKQTLKCQSCGHEWNSRTADPERCPECHTRSWRRIDSLGVAVPVTSGGESGSVTSGEKPVTTLAVTSLSPGGEKASKWKDSTATPGMYRICVRHSRRYCQKCASIQAVNLAEPGAVAARYQAWTEARKAGPLTVETWPYMADIYRPIYQNSPAAAWTDAHNMIAVQRKAAGKQPAEARH